MTKEHAHMVDMKLQDMIDDIHDYFCVLHERGIQISPAEYSQMVLTKVVELKEDLYDEFDEEADD